MSKSAEILERFAAAKSARHPWERSWRDCYRYTLPGRSNRNSIEEYAEIFDGTAADGVDNLAAGLLARVTPPWSRWLGFVGDESVGKQVRGWGKTLHDHFLNSNFVMEIHQCYLDLIITGTACLLFEEAPPGESSAFRFAAAPIWDVYLEETADGKLGTTYRLSRLNRRQFFARFPKAEPPKGNESEEIEVLEAVYDDGFCPRYMALLPNGEVLKRGSFNHSPFINFRWMKALGESYGRSPVMKTLPDIKTANKVVELTLKRASLAAAGMWQVRGGREDEEIEITPGGVITGESEITPIELPANFDVSQLVLGQLRERIRTALFADRLSLPTVKMTATEVAERAVETSRLMGATFGRLQHELLKPLAERAVEILVRRGELPPPAADRRLVGIEFLSPLAQTERRLEAQNLMTWLEAANGMGAEINKQAVAAHMARLLAVPPEVYESFQFSSAGTSR